MRLIEWIARILNAPTLRNGMSEEISRLKKTIASLEESVAARGRLLTTYERVVNELLIERNAAYDEIARLKEMKEGSKGGGD